MANDHSQIVPSMQPTSTVADFKFWCQKVLPLVYDDSISYYEVLGKMVVYLNQVIDNINADTANVAELEDDFLLLQTYVNNFFDDIDQLVTYTERAEAAETAALSSAASAAESATNAASSAVNAATSSGSAATSALSAMDAKDAAVAAKTAAETALANAQTAATNAAASATAAGNSATAASGSATNAAASATAAQNSFTLADAARVAAQSAANDAESAAELIDMDATASDVGKAIIVKTVGDGKVTAYEFGEASGGGAGGIINVIEDAAIASFDDGTDAPVVELVVDIKPVQSGSGDPAPDNVRPITGWTGANVMRTGKNLFNKTLPITYGYLISATGEIIENISYGYSDYYTPVKANTNYVFSGGIAQGVYNSVSFYTSDKAFISRFLPSESSVPAQFQTPNNCAFIRFNTSNSSNIYLDNIQLEEGTTATAYEPFGTTYSLTFPSEAGTVYGAKIDITSNTLTIETIFIEFDGTENEWTQYGTSILNTSVLINTESTTAIKGICSHCPQMSQYPTQINMTYLSHSNANRGVEFKNITTFWGLPDNEVTTWKSFLATQKANGTPLQILAYLQTPIIYQLDPITVKTLLGLNNLWADTGNIKLLKYIANGKQYIDTKDSLVKALIAKELSSMIADTALVANDFRIVNNTLYKITGNIASGGTLTPGTNCVATTIGEVLKTLLT